MWRSGKTLESGRTGEILLLEDYISHWTPCKFPEYLLRCSTTTLRTADLWGPHYLSKWRLRDWKRFTLRHIPTVGAGSVMQAHLGDPITLVQGFFLAILGPASTLSFLLKDSGGWKTEASRLSNLVNYWVTGIQEFWREKEDSSGDLALALSQWSVQMQSDRPGSKSLLSHQLAGCFWANWLVSIWVSVFLSVNGASNTAQL